MTELRWGTHKRHEIGHSSEACEAIITAATVCYIRLGLDTTGADIALQARVTRPTVYRYFHSVDSLREAVVARIWEGLRPREGSAVEWLESLENTWRYRLGRLDPAIELYPDFELVLLKQVNTVAEEGTARLFLSYLKLGELTGSPLPLFHAILGTSDYRFENGQAFNPAR